MIMEAQLLLSKNMLLHAPNLHTPVSLIVLFTLMMTVEGTDLILLTLSRWKPEGTSQITCKTCLTLIQVTASLVCPLPISGPLVTLRHLPFATGGHVIALWHGHVQSG